MLGGKNNGATQVQPTAPVPAHAIRFTTPVVETPAVFILGRWLWHLLAFVACLPVRFPVAVTGAALLAGSWWALDWVGPAVVCTLATITGLAWRHWHPATFRRWVTLRALALVREIWVYRRHWQPVLVVSGLAESYLERQYLPHIKRVTCTEWADRVRVKLVAGTAPAAFEERTPHLAHGFGAPACRVETAGPLEIVLEFPRHDMLADPLDALPAPATADGVDLAALPMGLCEDGRAWRMRLHGTHVLVAGVTGSGKGSVIWSAVRAMLPAIRAGLVRVWAVDPKRMELSYGRSLFHRYADDGESVVALLEDAVAEMQERAERYAGRVRAHTPSVDDPFDVVVLDEVAFLTAYHPDRDIRRRAESAMATLTSQGRSVGFAVLAALQDPRKEVMNLRNLFPDKIALRLDEASQVDMVLGSDARDRGADAHLIDPDAPGTAFVRVEGSKVPTRVRAAYVSDADIDHMTAGDGSGAPGAPGAGEGGA
ncbi:S-DNA-T family DNA segregation ATPase FtsK/SpoIIIE [Nocardiopsis mwathae]|uniref:S-DNA-T family DNA segregation ATPase FtsK/SpoIIIE n=1 Tax=Nocardiopsis mwathae TaxID=1472723 RepID=A0A7W9YM59_9ACTN|nr:FtsK/SpoIIIE domain-containing protein [Nocardiopsis mwathae]MBB6174703.1 S-DNA-T family DNA segregation ATPase FtsK/SpoIIIE [Nocardiopsis mwathae]